jgi:hypothetical protein
MATYRGSCHCGAIRFEVTGTIEALESCNCSLCSRTGYVHWYVLPAQFRLLTPEDAIRTYQFGTLTSKNHFCERCGVSPFRRPRSDPENIAVNVRCLEDVDLGAFPVKTFDGQNWERAMRSR